jgi:Putative beta-lactamase-inhibitor-like, PepSY-like
MRATVSLAGLLGVVAAVALVATVRADDKISLSQVPGAVLNATKAKFPNAELVSAVKEEENGKVTYEITIKDNDQNADVEVTLEGKILAVEKTMSVKKVPRAVVAGLKARHPHAAIKKAKQIFKDDKLTAYELVVAIEGESKSTELTFQPDGKPVEEEKAADPSDKK